MHVYVDAGSITLLGESAFGDVVRNALSRILPQILGSQKLSVLYTLGTCVLLCAYVIPTRRRDNSSKKWRTGAGEGLRTPLSDEVYDKPLQCVQNAVDVKNHPPFHHPRSAIDS